MELNLFYRSIQLVLNIDLVYLLLVISYLKAIAQVAEFVIFINNVFTPVIALFILQDLV